MMVSEVMFSTEHVPQLSITDSNMKWPLRFTFSYVQSISQYYKQRTVEEAPLQSIQSPHKLQMIAIIQT